MDLSLQVIGIIVTLLFLFLMFLRMPVGISMLVAGFIGIWLTRGLPGALSLTGMAFYKTASTHYLIIIPLFVWMGMLASTGGLSKDAFSSMNKWVGHLPGGLAMAATGACAAFGAVCGTHVAAAATMVSAAYPEMRKYGYDNTYSLACIAAGGTLGILIPPSNAFVVYGFVTETSIGSLFIAGILPGILLVLMLWVQIYLQCKFNPKLAPKASSATWKERIFAVKGVWGILVVFLIVMGGIYAGIFTPTEAAAIGVAAVFLIGLIGRQLNWKKIGSSLREAGLITAMIMLLMLGAMVFSSFITTSEITLTLGRIIEGLEVNRYIILAVVLVVYMICGFFMDIFAILIISLPIMFPIVVTTLGFDPVFFGVLAVLTVMMGGITPPFGVVVYAVHGMIREVPLFALFRGCIPFFLTMVACLIILAAFPQISTILPNMAIPYR